jgi:hypothetical protein
MIRYSHVSLLIPCDSVSAATITAALGVEPTRIRESKSQVRAADGNFQERVHHTWMFDSPKSHTDGDPTVRLHALADAIEPFAARLPSIQAEYKPFVDIVYHVTPQHPHGITGEFDWFRMPAELMRRYGAWDLTVSYETFWFSHPDWKFKRRGWLSKILESFRHRWPNNSPEPPPITVSVPPSRLTRLAARLSFCRWRLNML